MSVEVSELANISFKPLHPTRIEGAHQGEFVFDPQEGPTVLIKTDPENPASVTVSRGERPFQHLFKIDVSTPEGKTEAETPGEPKTIVTLLGRGKELQGKQYIDKVDISGPAVFNAFGPRIHVEPKSGREIVTTQFGATSRNPKAAVK